MVSLWCPFCISYVFRFHAIGKWLASYQIEPNLQMQLISQCGARNVVLVHGEKKKM
jgi:hypothetical protein